MRVLHVVTGLGDGGAEAVLHRLVAHDPHDEHHVLSLTGPGKYGPMFEAAGVPVHALNMPRGRVTVAALRRHWRLIGSVQPDVVQTWMYHADFLGGLMARLRGLPVVWGIHNTTLAPGRSSWATFMVARACAIFSHWVPDKIVVCAEAAARVHATMGYDGRRMVVIPNGYNLSHFVPNVAARVRWRLTHGIEPNAVLLGTVARFDPQKDHTNLIAALSLLARRGVEFTAVLVGSGVDEHNRELVQQVSAAGLGDCVRLLGPTTDVPSLMNALDVHVLPSAAEAFPNVLAEAMACGTPCVTTDVGDAAQIVADTGWIVPPRDPEALAKAIQRALSDMSNAQTWVARKARCRQRIVQHFGIETMVARYREAWRAVCADRPAVNGRASE